ncbi:MAG: DUF4926 domain-containing protein [Anaerolineae bacterium]|jgi:hypothetical protein|nr:DUF4926 domain-containing protein [Anaerolineae bacterium]
MIEELTEVVLTEDIAEQGLKMGDVGMVVHVYANPAGYEVEFVTLTGEFVALVAVHPHQIRPIAHDEIANVRRVQIGI